MNIDFQFYIKKLKEQFSNVSIRDIKWLVADILQTNSQINIDISLEQENLILQKIKQLNNGKPLAYVLNWTPFYNCKFFIDENVLIPRFETELLVEKIIKYANNLNQNLHILDLCSGSGCIGITLQKNLNCKVDVVELSENACKIIKKNANINNSTIKIIKSNMFDKISQKYDIIVSNPPYIPTSDIETLDPSVKNFEPKLALDGGPDGLDFYRIIAKNSFKFLKNDGKLFLEIGFNQANAIKKLLEPNFFDINIYKDLSGKDRFIQATNRGKL